MIRGSHRSCKWFVVSGLAFLVGMFAAAPARAELDFEYAKALIEHDEPSFGTDDLIERFVAKLLDSPATEAEGKLIKATFLRRQAAAASAEKKNKLLVEADKLYKDIVAGDKKYRNYAIAERESAGMTSELIKSQIDLAGDDKDKARQLRSEAAAGMEKIASGHKATMEASEPKFKDQYTKYQKYVKDHTNQESGELDHPYPSADMDMLMKMFMTTGLSPTNAMSRPRWSRSRLLRRHRPGQEGGRRGNGEVLRHQDHQRNPGRLPGADVVVLDDAGAHLRAGQR